MREAWSQLEQAWRDTLVHRAEAAAFGPLSLLYGVPHAEDEVPENSWAEVLKLNAYGTRGNFDTVFKSTEAALAHLNVKVPGYVESASPAILRANNVWPANIVNRLIRKGDKIYFSKSLLSPSQLAVVEQGSFYWDEPTESSTRQDYVFEVLPFVIHERSPGRVITSDPDAADFFTAGSVCLFEVILFAQPDLVFVPKTWLQAPTTYETPEDVATVEGVPFGGAVLSGETGIGNPSGFGPHPLYAYDSVIFPKTARTMSSTMAASVEYRILMNPPV